MIHVYIYGYIAVIQVYIKSDEDELLITKFRSYNLV